MKSISTILMVIAVLLSSTYSFAQIKNAKTATVTVYGNCDMCKATIEKAGNVKKVATVEWNKDTKIASLTYNSDKTNQDEILKRIALAGYDSEKFLAPDDVYAKLPDCCKYNRVIKPVAKDSVHSVHDHGSMAASQNVSPLTPIFNHYFSVKDALVKTDAATAAANAATLVSAVGATDMSKLSTAEHTVWMKVMKGISDNAESISRSKDIAGQRQAFAALSAQIYQLAKVSKQETPVYYQHCPMFNGGKGANWLSRENTVKNPFYGSQMLTCGSTVETINQ